MAKHNFFGQQGEEQAAAFLLERGYRILSRNWRIGHLELDIICEEPNCNCLIIVEVKSRWNRRERKDELITSQKRRNLLIAADAYLKTYKINQEVRFDLIIFSGEDNHIEYIKEIITIID